MDESSSVMDTNKPQARSPVGDTDATTDSERAPWVVRFLVQLEVILLVYVLSTGPLYWTIHRAYHFRGSPFIAQLYYPLVVAAESSDTVSDVLDWYVGMWIYDDAQASGAPELRVEPFVRNDDQQAT